MTDRIVSEHIRVRVPLEIEWLGREAVVDLERCYGFLKGSLDGKMPRRVVIDILPENDRCTADPATGRIKIGMGHPAAGADMRSYLVHNASREMARLGLLALGRAASAPQGVEFLYEGMSETLAREFAHNTLKLEIAWTVAHLLDRMGLLGLAAQSDWASFAGGNNDLRAAAPGITFLATCRELFGRARIRKLFEELPRRGLAEGISAAFRSRPENIERAWLEKARKHRMEEESGSGEAPRPERTVFLPAAARPGDVIQIRFYMRPGPGVLLPEGLFVEDDRGRIVAGRAGLERDGGFLFVDIPIAKDRQPGLHTFRAIAIDYSGSLGTWRGSYTVAP